MSRVFISEGTGAGIYVFSDDHCPAHVHARHRGEGWIARVRFLTRRTTCLANQWAFVRGPGRIELLSKPAPSAKQIAETEYDPANEQVHVVFDDGTTEQVQL
jgi:hypothetical protein